MGNHRGSRAHGLATNGHIDSTALGLLGSQTISGQEERGVAVTHSWLFLFLNEFLDNSPEEIISLW